MRPKTEKLMLIFMDKSAHEEHLSQPLQTNNKRFKIAITFLTGYNVSFKVTDKYNKLLFRYSITGKDGYIQITIPPGAYEIDSLNKGIERIIFVEEH